MGTLEGNLDIFSKVVLQVTIREANKVPNKFFKIKHFAYKILPVRIVLFNINIRLAI
jgi:hypothetical protein